jgi:tetratricopeptide (TPR) repeat protein
MNTKSKKQSSNILMSKAKPIAMPLNTQIYLALSYHQQGRLQDAAKLYESVVLANPLHDEAWHMYGLVANQLGNHKQAIEQITKAINLDSKKAKYFNNRGLIYQQLLQFTEALDDFQESLQLDPNLSQAHCNKGNILQELHRYDEAKDSFSTAIHIDPEYADAYFNRGNLWVILKNIEKAIEDFDRALSLLPRDADYTYNKSMALLLNGQYGLGWELYESRWHRESSKNHKREFSAPLWLGNESIKDKKILIYAEQGLGDSIQFIRYVPLSSFQSIFCDAADFYSLQIEYRTHDIDFINAHPKIIDFSNELEDFSDTACLCDLMDLIITVDTSVAHLSAALGKLTWLLVPHNPDFRWFNDRQDSPWYPSIQIFRQNSIDNWNQTLNEISQELTKFIVTLEKF